jgi:steroid delta-isomerase-like uncharacterized protein
MKNFRSNLLLALGLLVLVLLGGCQPVRADAPRAMTTEEMNLAVVQRFYDEFAAGNMEVILEIHPEMLRMHYAGEAEDVPTQILYEDMDAIKKANPDLHAEIHSMIARDDIVITELTWTTTHTGDYFGIPATGKTSAHNGIVVRRFEDGKIVESWEIWDDLAFLQSIGYLPSWDEIIATPLAE